MLRSFFVRIGILMVLLFHAQSGLAQVAANAAQGDFRWTVVPYAWLTGISGTVGAKGYTAQVDAPFTNLAKYLNFGAMLHVEAMYRDRVGLFSDFNYSVLGDQASGKRLSLDAKTSLLLSDVVAFYRVGTVPLGQAGTSSMDFDLLAGARIWNLALKLNGDSRRGGRDIFKQKTWADPIVGARAEFHLTDRWLISLRGGLGGFSVSSALTWDATALVGYTFWEHGTVLLGYRAVGDKYDTGSGESAFKFDATLSGPILGVAFTF
uniref:Outer membrane protein beta-barrel domain-containing protein n=1 Tax=Desulfovibrio sp. U5L TaxID=596152 RepID=I2Q5F1_9BACT